MPPVPFVPARWYTPTEGRRIDLLVVHSAEVLERTSSAAALAAYFARGERRASAHACVDDEARVDCVGDQDVAWAAPGANHNGLQLELTGFARQSREEWLDPFGRAMLEGPAAEWLAAKATRYAIPLVELGPAELVAGARGVCTHAAVSVAFRRSDHTDPGGAFPMDVLLAAARLPGGPPPADGDAMDSAQSAEALDHLRAIRAELLDREDRGNLWRVARNMHHQLVVPGVGLQALVERAALPASGLDPAVIAQAVVTAVGPRHAQEVADAILARLAEPPP